MDNETDLCVLFRKIQKDIVFLFIDYFRPLCIVTCCSIFIIAGFTSIYRIIAGAYSYLLLHTPLCQ
jgi:hypothetical protein